MTDSQTLKDSHLLMVVEDDPAVSQLLEMMIAREGYAVILASNGQEAMSILNERNLPISMVLTDISMPDMSGENLIIQLEQHYPKLPVLVLTGHDITENDYGTNVVDILRKPFRSANLIERIKLALV